MKAISMSISRVFSGGGDVQYTLPHFQREYAWDKENWEILLEDLWDVYEIYDPNDEPEHFMGALIVIEDGTHGTIPIFKLVDGQQRLTTISVLLCALGYLVKATHPELYRRIRKALLNVDEKDLLYYKLIPTAKRGDRDTYTHILHHEVAPANSESRIGRAYEYFLRNLRAKLPHNDPEKLALVILNCLHVVFITLDQREKAYEIFESLNAKGKPLTAPDLVRNYIAMRLSDKYQEEIFDSHWLKIEETLNENRTRLGIGELTAFLRHYLSLRSQSLCARDRVYQRFRDRMEKEFTSSPEAFVGEVKTLHRYAIYYDRLLRPEHEPNTMVSERLRRLNTLEISTAYPFLMQVYADWETDIIGAERFCEVLDILENYTMRRYLANMPSNYTNKLYPTLYREIDTGYYTDTLRRALITKNYPSDKLIREVIRQRRLYEVKAQPRLAFLFEGINRHLSRNTGGYTTLDGAPTIEHIFPQTPSREWQNQFDESDIHEILRDYLHTLGNLTIVTREWNASLSNSTYDIKRQKLANHALLINQAYFNRQDTPQSWDKNAIIARTDALTDIILTIWASMGEVRVDTSNYTNKKPYAVSFLGDIYEVNSWRAVLIKMAEIGIEFGVFEEMRERFPRTFTLEAREGSRSQQLSNDWWLYTQRNANNVMDFCARVTDLMGVSDEDWEVLYE